MNARNYCISPSLQEIFQYLVRILTTKTAKFKHCTPTMDTLALIGRFLDDDKQNELLEKYASRLEESNENVDNLADLLTIIKIKDDHHVITTIQLFINRHILDKSYNAAIAKLVQTVPTLQSSIFHHVTSLITSFISRNKNFFNPSFYQLFSFTKPTTEKEEIAEEELLAILDLVDLICQTNSSETTTLASNTCPKSTQLDTLLLILLGIDDQTIAETASKIFKWRITALSADDSKFDITWKVVFALQSSSLKIFHTQQAYILWLRYLNNSASNIASNKQFAELIQNDYYWSAIQIGLTSNLHEHRKYSLSILTMSIKSINLDFENKFVKWDTKEQDLYLNEWARYITLYEIIAVDTSLHQAEAGINDMTALISSSSRIFSSWGWALLSTGFKATIDSVRKFTMRLLLSIPLENLYLIKSALPILEKDILPNLMTASHLHVKTIDGVVNCAYVEKLQSFIMHMFQNLKDPNDN
ncbi:hypothetical protein LELG_04542 [Lodderomyces elongisporus NRRL YB-4239]|uniref:Uncharacterized protein n=1 Tax=Lodderomyces elongisporus (strain ATCC 11503 / CBS 2605 / JCM 1781 / NBRC 1676 / NRRL YB-4239) TaxID=379508 RepID=A5E4K3_LODEL|nr:hypothetical protein LELG_04542 [Lodderomyces elongisporus NRRL YB-4239]